MVKIKFKRPIKPIIVITFDDVNISDYWAYEEMKSRGYSGTSYGPSSLIGNTGRLTWHQLKKMHEAGWDLQCHTHSHNSSSMSLGPWSEKQIRDEMKLVNHEFERNGFRIPEHTCAVAHVINEGGRQIVSEYRKTIRTGQRQAVNRQSTMDFHRINFISQRKDWGYDYDTEEGKERVKEVLIDTKRNNYLTVLLFHELTEDVPTLAQNGPGYINKMSKGNFIKVLDMIDDLNLSVMTIDEMYNYVNRTR